MASGLSRPANSVDDILLGKIQFRQLRTHRAGSLDAHGCLVPDPQAEPLAVQYTPRRGRAGARITFLTPQARAALCAALARRAEAGEGIDADAPLIARPDGSRATVASVARARRRNAALIRAGSQVNVALCRATGDFFREWGLPGSRFVASQTSTRS